MNHKTHLAAIAISIFFISCTSSRKLVYFNNVGNSTFAGTGKTTGVLITSNDILSINISSLNAEASAIFNTNNQSTSRTTTLTGANTESGGYLVNPEGYIQLPVLGKIKVEGLTKDQIKNNITKLILDQKLLRDPLVEVRFLNYEVTVLGEVGRPTVITVPSEKISMLKAIGLAGDLTIFGKRENVLLIREENGQKVTRHIDLTSPDFLQSPYYYLEPNDVVYVQPNNARATQATMWPQLVPILLTALSVTVIVLDRVLR
jgi:polysaccharide export outer membrane protein